MPHDRENVRFNVLRNAHYHTARRRGLERASRIFNLLVILLGAAAVGDLATGLGIGQVWIGVLVALTGALQLVFDFGRQARDHQALQRDYFRLLAKIEGTIDPDPAQVAQWYGEMISITADEPPLMRALDARAYNDTIDATEIYPADQRLVVPWWHARVSQIVAFEGYNYKKRCELGQSGA